MNSTAKYSPRYYGTWSDRRRRGRVARFVAAATALAAGAAFLLWAAVSR